MAKQKSKSTKTKNTSTSNINYIGNVTVKVVGSKNTLRKQYKLKNKGYSPLFEFIVYSLSGNFEVGLLPKYVATYQIQSTPAVESAFNTADTILTCVKPIVKSSTVKTSVNGDINSTIELSFVIPGSSLTSGSSINCLALYCDEYYTTFNGVDDKKPSAVVVLDEALEVSSDESVVVVWELSVGNNSSQA